MKILFFIDSLRSGGKERRLVELIKSISFNKNIQMELVLTKEIIHYPEIFSIDIKIHYILRKKGVKKDPRLFFNFYKIAKVFEPDIIHVWGNLVAIYAIPAKIFLKTPMINNQITNANKQKSTSFLSHSLTFPFSDRIVANTKAGIIEYRAPIKKSRVIYNGFDFKRLNNLEDKTLIRNKFKLRTKYIVGMVASFNEKKDYTAFILAANMVLKNRTDVTFVGIGSGDFLHYKELVEPNNENKIIFLGRQENVESFMNVCDLGVLMTDKNYNEGISNSILEFLALGKPVIASKGGGTNEIIDHEVNGILINANDYENLAEKVLYLLKNEEDRKKLGVNAKNSVIKKFSISNMRTKFMNLYFDTLEK